MKLALARGLSHYEFLQTTSAKEIREYQALDSIDPLFDGDRLDILFARLELAVINSIGKAFGGRRFRSLKLSDVLHEWDAEAPKEETPAQTPTEQLKVVEELNKLFKGKDLRAEKQKAKANS
jgi:hypothetical protein